MVNLADRLRAKEVNIVEVPGWQTHARPFNFAPVGVMIHHTAGSNSLNVVRNGRSGLPGPLAQFLIAKSGNVYLISQGYCNHAGAGNESVLKLTKADKAPTGKATQRGSLNGNAHYWGIEVENLGNGRDEYTAEQIRSLVALCAALCEIHKWTPNRIVHHKEWTSRKIDMSYRGDVRGMVRDVMAGQAPRRVNVDCSGGTFQSGDKGDCVVEIQNHLVRHGFEVSVDGDFGPKTKAAVERFQEAKRLTVDGIVGPNSWKVLKAALRPAPSTNESPVLKAGMTHDCVASLRVYLNKAGYEVAEDSRYFNGWLETVVRTFQKDRGLTVDGIVGPNTWTELRRTVTTTSKEAACEERVFELGSVGDCVKKIQTHLRSSGFNVVVDGDFGPKTKEAVAALQRSFSISADGVVGPQTWKYLPKQYQVQKAVVYRDSFGKGLAMLLAKKLGVPCLSYLDTTSVKSAILIHDAADHAGRYPVSTVLRGTTISGTIDKVYQELVG